MTNNDKALHEANLADIHHGSEPGSFGCHELLDRTHIIANQIDSLLLSHPACKQNPEWQELAKHALSSLTELYQHIGSVHLGSDTTESSSDAVPTIEVESPSNKGVKMDIRDLINFEVSPYNEEETQRFFDAAHKIIMDGHSSNAQRLTAMRVFKQVLGYEAEANQQELYLYTIGAWNGRKDVANEGTD